MSWIVKKRNVFFKKNKFDEFILISTPKCGGMSLEKYLSNSGYSLSRTLLMNIVTGCAMISGAILAYFILNDLELLIPIILSFAASSMIYVAISDLIPSLHKKVEIKQTFQQTFSIFLGVLIIYFLHSLIH